MFAMCSQIFYAEFLIQLFISANRFLPFCLILVLNNSTSFCLGSRYDGFPISTFCGRTIPQPFGVAFPETFVQFISDPYTTDKGFFASYSFTSENKLILGCKSLNYDTGTETSLSKSRF